MNTTLSKGLKRQKGSTFICKGSEPEPTVHRRKDLDPHEQLNGTEATQNQKHESQFLKIEFKAAELSLSENVGDKQPSNVVDQKKRPDANMVSKLFTIFKTMIVFSQSWRWIMVKIVQISIFNSQKKSLPHFIMVLQYIQFYRGNKGTRDFKKFFKRKFQPAFQVSNKYKGKMFIIFNKYKERISQAIQAWAPVVIQAKGPKPNQFEKSMLDLYSEHFEQKGEEGIQKIEWFREYLDQQCRHQRYIQVNPNTDMVEEQQQDIENVAVNTQQPINIEEENQTGSKAGLMRQDEDQDEDQDQDQDQYQDQDENYMYEEEWQKYVQWGNN